MRNAVNTWIINEVWVSSGWENVEYRVLFIQNGVVSSVRSQMLWLTMKQVSYKTNPYYIKSNFKDS